MKLIVPELKVEEDNPFSRDLFQRNVFAESLTNLIKNIDDNLVVSIDADWGEGKTTFINMWRAHLQLQGIKTIYFDSFKNDYSNDPFIDIASEILSFIEVEYEKNAHIVKAQGELKNKTVQVGKKLLGWSAKVAVKAATLGAIKDSDIEELENVANDIANGASDVVSNAILERINSHKSQKDSLESFNTKIGELGSAVKELQNFPLLIIVDELDRCRPTYAVETIEKIKHLFSAKNVVFVIAVNKRQLHESIRSVYGKIDAESYLKKFIQIETSLPRRHGYKQTNDFLQYANYLFEELGFPSWLQSEADDINKIMACYAEYFGISLREMERAYTYLIVYYASVTERTANFTPVITFLAIVRLKYPEKFKALKNGKYSYQQFEDEFKISGISKEYYSNVYPDYFVTCFKFFLYTGVEYHNNKQGTDLEHMNLRGVSMSRLRFIPWYCEQIDAFSVNIT
ncbi:KAP family P-loop NTPase fold protein [Vibrio splendidus]|uniref:KAP family P-loop NTPase fold protein n=1 Tax=Vibrio splendidus TaxID=29497 RepID=UPI0015E6DA7D|nr:P-loop NTPase fold protein [Vibrio splendidus]